MFKFKFFNLNIKQDVWSIEERDRKDIRGPTGPNFRISVKTVRKGNSKMKYF